jgi:hypothetical protein
MIGRVHLREVLLPGKPRAADVGFFLQETDGKTDAFTSRENHHLQVVESSKTDDSQVPENLAWAHYFLRSLDAGYKELSRYRSTVAVRHDDGPGRNGRNKVRRSWRSRGSRDGIEFFRNRSPP